MNRAGSPPPMRGKGAEGGTNLRNIRITPAYAGKSLPHLPRLLWGWDHPRLCGEKFLATCGWGKHGGSPPPMRGKGTPERIDLRHVGITPAYAGKRIPCAANIDKPEDHPRLCGEKVYSMASVE